MPFVYCSTVLLAFHCANLLLQSVFSSSHCTDIYFIIFTSTNLCACDKWVPVTMAWRILRFRMKERPPKQRVAANIMHMQSRTANNGWCFSLVVGWSANNSSLWKCIFVTKYSQTKPRTWNDTLAQPKQRMCIKSIYLIPIKILINTQVAWKIYFTFLSCDKEVYDL
jgi:hypothetical protein